MNDSEKRKLEIIKKVKEGILTRKEAKVELSLSLKQIDRLRTVLDNEGEEGFIHKNRGKPSKNKISQTIIEELKILYNAEYYDYNMTAFYEEITENKKYKGKYDISYSTLYNAFLNDDIISPIAHKGTIKLYNDKMNKAIKNKNEILQEKIELFHSRQIAFENAFTRKSSNMYGFGQEVQMDACEKRWFGNIVSYLHLAVDKGTKKVLFVWFEFEELTRSYFVLLYNIIINFGIPKRIKTDNRNSFSNPDNKVDTTQFGVICNMLWIELTTTSVSTAKANVEWENETFKNRLIAELRHENITSIDEANKYLNEVFIPKINRKFSYQINPDTSKMKENPYSEEELDLIISEKYQRIIDNASSIKYKNKYYVLVDNNTGEIACFMNKTQCKFIISYHGEYWCEIENKYYSLKEIESRDTTMKKEIISKPKTEKRKYIPPKNSYWRRSMFIKKI